MFRGLFLLLLATLLTLSAADGTYGGAYQWGKKSNTLTGTLSTGENENAFTMVLVATWKGKPHTYTAEMMVAGEKVTGTAVVKKGQPAWRFSGTFVDGKLEAQFEKPDGANWKREGTILLRKNP